MNKQLIEQEARMETLERKIKKKYIIIQDVMKKRDIHSSQVELTS